VVKIAAPVGRSVTEWIGKTPDSMPPPSVELRILRRYKGRCHLSDVHIGAKAWHVEHIKPLWAGGENRESNLAPALGPAHAEKTKEEAHSRAKADNAAMRAAGLKKGKTKIPSRPKEEKPASGKLPLPPRRPMFK
jgi:5-methylcytosine-specific restriction enzyme A